MEFVVDPKSPLPIYAQLIEQITLAIARGTLKTGMQLPTVRQLAVDLRISPNTVAQAYRDLESAGYIATRQGRGTFVNERPPPAAPGERQARLEALFHKALGEAAALGLNPDEFLSHLIQYIRAHEGGKTDGAAVNNGHQ
ncbi:MAG TPA: GntR family transcriptional regulator [Chthonomonadaceae bacterium]|nr:GntR family transcriptional regulator [Chthonomonadaceae bacterium]